ncbi:TIGR04282 family arsenosugar biosynthesis glycosyltransferase [Plantactinospora sp. WMMB782]|uniref:TIGR04282 family arsenosugar biosynthesis glycosyltransferase n=1 Tax=Plantactinospora sp. WMMB782 TaxID=3404121 RepID=UPI003B947941
MNVLLVVAKAPVPGLAKTRLCPPATPRQAARIAAAALLDTLSAVRDTGATVPVLAHTGRFSDAEHGAELATALSGWHLLRQHGETFADRLAQAHAEVGAAFPGLPVLQIGMDTPQVRPDILADALHRLAGTDAVLGPAVDGGWWALGLRDPAHAAVLRQVPMSTADTGRLTLAALRSRGVRVTALPVLPDVDDWPAALAVADQLPGSRFSRAVDAVGVPAPGAGARR